MIVKSRGLPIDFVNARIDLDEIQGDPVAVSAPCVLREQRTYLAILLL
jgi:hypothetical protein